MYYKDKQNIVEEVRTSGKIVPIDGNIYWHIENFTKDMPKYKVILAFEQMFKILQPYVKPTFESTSNPKLSQITIRFRNNTAPDLPVKFDAQTLAYAFLANNSTALNLVSDMFFNENFTWAEVHKPKHINLLKVAVHECLHALGLYHSDDKNDILYYMYQPNNDITFTKDTIDSIYRLYGKPEAPSGENDEGEGGTQKPEGEIDYIKIYKEILPNKNDLNRILEDQVVLIAKNLGIDASADDLKKDTINKIIQKYND